MVLIPGGPFLMGADATDGRVGVQIGVDSLPKHTVTVAPFWIDRTEVTHAAYRDFVQATARRPPEDPHSEQFYHWESDKVPAGMENHPVVYVDWHDAHDYCACRRRRSGRRRRGARTGAPFRGAKASIRPGATPARRRWDGPPRSGPWRTM